MGPPYVVHRRSTRDRRAVDCVSWSGRGSLARPASPILATMAARTVVVRRPRRRLFEILRQLPRWLRAVASASPRRPLPPDSALLGLGRRPGLLWTTEGGHRCVGCGRCIGACPGRALTLELAEEGEPGVGTVRTKTKTNTKTKARTGTRTKKNAPAARQASLDTVARVTRFELAPGRCLACGLCIELCPESALVQVAGATLVGAGPEPRRLRLIDLLQAAP